MKKQELLEKTLTLAIIILLTSAIIPSVNAGRAITKEIISINKDYNPLILNAPGPIPNIAGTPGKNYWYTSSVTISFSYYHDQVKEIWYKIGSGNLQQYKDSPFVISTEGKTSIAWYWIDYQNQTWHEPAIFLQIDKSTPTIKLTKISGSNNQVIFTATCEDKISGMDHVEFYLDDELQATVNETPYKWTWIGTSQHSVHATAYDMAGLKKDSATISTPRINTNFLQFINEIIQKIIYKIWH